MPIVKSTLGAMTISSTHHLNIVVCRLCWINRQERGSTNAHQRNRKNNNLLHNVITEITVGTALINIFILNIRFVFLTKT